jgi:hypothetical protein
LTELAGSGIYASSVAFEVEVSSAFWNQHWNQTKNWSLFKFKLKPDSGVRSYLERFGFTMYISTILFYFILFSKSLTTLHFRQVIVVDWLYRTNIILSLF